MYVCIAFFSDSIPLAGLEQPWVNGGNVRYTILITGWEQVLTILAYMSSKGTTFYHKICPAMGHAKFPMSISFNFFAVRLKLRRYSEFFSQRLKGTPPQHKSLSTNRGLNSRHFCPGKNVEMICLQFKVFLAQIGPKNEDWRFLHQSLLC